MSTIVKDKWPMDCRERPMFCSPMSKAIRELVIDALDRTGISVAELSRRSGVSYDVINKLKRRANASTSAENADALRAAIGALNSHSQSLMPEGASVKASPSDWVGTFVVAAMEKMNWTPNDVAEVSGLPIESVRALFKKDSTDKVDVPKAARSKIEEASGLRAADYAPDALYAPQTEFTPAEIASEVQRVRNRHQVEAAPNINDIRFAMADGLLQFDRMTLDRDGIAKLKKTIEAAEALLGD